MQTVKRTYQLCCHLLFPVSVDCVKIQHETCLCNKEMFCFPRRDSAKHVAEILGIQSGWHECLQCFSFAYLSLHLPIVFCFCFLSVLYNLCLQLLSGLISQLFCAVPCTSSLQMVLLNLQCFKANGDATCSIFSVFCCICLIF